MAEGADERTQRLAAIKATLATTQSRTTLVADRWWLVQQVDALMAEVGALRQALEAAKAENERLREMATLGEAVYEWAETEAAAVVPVTGSENG